MVSVSLPSIANPHPLSPAVTILHLLYHFYHSLLTPLTAIELSIFVAFTFVLYLIRDRLMDCFLDWHWGVTY